MNLTSMNREEREDVKCALRKQFGSIFAFERRHNLPAKSVSDTLRGRPNDRVTKAIEMALAAIDAEQSDKSDDNPISRSVHRLSAGAR